MFKIVILLFLPVLVYSQSEKTIRVSTNPLNIFFDDFSGSNIGPNLGYGNNKVEGTIGFSVFLKNKLPSHLKSEIYPFLFLFWLIQQNKPGLT